MQVNLTDVIAPSFYDLFWDVWEELYTHYWNEGGRGSTKSSFISVEIIMKIMDDAEKGIMSHGVVFRRVKEDLSTSVYEQLCWAIEKLGVTNDWYMGTSPLVLKYKPTGQKIMFRGLDEPKKAKGIKVRKGWIKYIWYEEVDEVEGKHKIDIVNQTLLRGGPKFLVFYSFNPPQSQRNWVNREVLETREDKIVHHSTYLEVPVDWLGEQFVIEAEHLKKVNPTKYNHDYLGEVTGTGGEVFTNVIVRKISAEEIKVFDKIKNGLDFGYAADPLAFVRCHYDKTRKILYIFDEIYKAGLGNSAAVELIKIKNPDNKRITADSAEPRTINEFRNLGISIIGARKGPDSIEHGIKFLSTEIEAIVIDNERCPNVAREFLSYELKRDKEGNFRGDYPDKDNHSIDAVRYAMEEEMLDLKAKVKKKSMLGIR
ncbi:MAG: PBSX family phage terminase large subunit [Sarcina sp.]